MRYIQLRHNQNNKQRYSISIPGVARPQVASTSIVDLGTPSDKVHKGILLSEHEFHSLMDTFYGEMADIVEVREIFDPATYLDYLTAEDWKKKLIINDGGNVVWTYMDTSNTPSEERASSITHADPETNVAFTLATTFTSEIEGMREIPVKWTATANPGVNIEINKESGKVKITQDKPGTISASLTMTVDMADYCKYHNIADYIGKDLKGSRTFNLEVNLIN